jgi:hypothetical protein
MDELLVNHTPLAARVFEHVDVGGVTYALVVAKASWDLTSGKQRTSASGKDALAPVRDNPEQCYAETLSLEPTQLLMLGERAQAYITVADHDQTPPKPRFDVIVQGYAHAPGQKPCVQFEAGVAVGTVTATIRAIAPRYWARGLRGLDASEPVAAVTRVPIHHGFTFSECSIRLSDEALELHRARRSKNEWQEEDVSIPPWIEASAQRITSLHATNATACLGQWPEHASHRRQFVGTFDESWKRYRAPKLPLDFNPRFFNIADPELQLDRAPDPGTPLRLMNLSERGSDQTVYPQATVSVSGYYNVGTSRIEAVPMQADTLVFEPELSRYSIVWRGLVPLRKASLQRMTLHYSERVQ